MDHARVECCRCARDGFGPRGLHGIELLPSALEQNADEIDHDVGLARGRLDRGRMAHVGLHGMDLADPSQRLEEAGKLGSTARDTDAVAELCQRAHNVTAEKTRAAEYGDECLERNGSHACSKSLARRIQDRFDAVQGAHLTTKGLLRT